MDVRSIGMTKLPLMQAGAARQNGIASGQSFGDFLKEAIGEVTDLQIKAEQASVDLATGKIDDIAQVVIAAEKATVALQMAIQVRNKVLESYQEMMRLQV